LIHIHMEREAKLIDTIHIQIEREAKLVVKTLHEDRQWTVETQKSSKNLLQVQVHMYIQYLDLFDQRDAPIKYTYKR